MATSSGRLARNVYMKNLIAAYFLRGPPHTAMRKYIGIRPTSQKTKNWKRSRDRNTPLIVVSMNRNIAKNAGTRWCSSHPIAKASGVRSAFRKTRTTESSSAPRMYFTLRDGTHGLSSTAKYVWFPAVVIVGSEITFVQRNPVRRTVDRPRTIRENVSATAFAARSDPVMNVKTAPTAGRRTMYVRIGNSINIYSPPSQGNDALVYALIIPRNGTGKSPTRKTRATRTTYEIRSHGRRS